MTPYDAMLETESITYVSLFGISDLDQLQDALFTNAVALPTIVGASDVKKEEFEKEGRVAALMQRTRDAKDAWRKITGLLPAIPTIGDLGPFARSAAFLSVRKYIVCIDDVERRGASLSVRDVLGLVSMLREQRQCRIIVILNSDALSSADADALAEYKEKVFDDTLQFDPNPEECAAIVFTGDDWAEQAAAAHSIRLRVTNIRILERIRALVFQLRTLVPDVDRALLEQLIPSVVLLAWSFYSRTQDAPPYEYVKKLGYSKFLSGRREGELSAEEKRWRGLLQGFGYTNTDELDLAVCRILERGYLDTEDIAPLIADKLEILRRGQLEKMLREAWGIYHNEFDPDPSWLVSAFLDAFRDGSEVISAMNASAATQLLRQLGCTQEAKEATDLWVQAQLRSNPYALNIDGSSWSSEVRDPEFRTAAQAAFNSATLVQKSLRETALAIATKNSWSNDDIAVLTGASVDDYVHLFRSVRSDETRQIVSTCLGFEGLDHSDRRYTTIGRRARKALEQLASESRLNQLRAESHGVRVPSSQSTAPSDARIVSEQNDE